MLNSNSFHILDPTTTSPKKDQDLIKTAIKIKVISTSIWNWVVVALIPTWMFSQWSLK